MKTLILVRHAHALGSLEAGVQKDSLRPLSPKGLEKAAQTAQLLKNSGYGAQAILHSPLLRACQTADILSGVLKAPLQPCAELDGMHADQDVCDFLTQSMQEKDCLIAVGHNPNISCVLYLLTGQNRYFAPGSFAAINMQDEKNPKLICFED